MDGTFYGAVVRFSHPSPAEVEAVARRGRERVVRLAEARRAGAAPLDRAREALAQRITLAIAAATADGRAEMSEFLGFSDDPVAWLEASPYRDVAALERELAGRTAPLQLTERQRRELESAGFTESDISKLCMAAGRRGGDSR